MREILIALLSIIGLLSTPVCAIGWDPVQTIPAVSPPSQALGPVSLAYDTTNNLIFAAWLDHTTNTPFFSIFDNISGAWSTPAQIANRTTNNAIYLSYDSTAKIMVATWNDSSTNNPFYSFYNGSVWSSAAAISNAFVAFDGVRTTFDSGAGNIIAAWSDNNFPFNPIYSIYTSNTNTWTVPQTITIQQVFDDVTLTYDSASHQVFAAWIANNTGLPSYAILTAGVWTSASINLTNPGSTQSKNVLLTYDTSNGQVYAAWGTVHPLVSVFSSANPAWSTPIAISSVGALNSEVNLGYSSASEQVVAAWLDSGIPRYAITDSAGATWTEGVISPNPVANTAISLAFDSGLNEIFAAWSNASSGSPADPVYSTLLTPDMYLFPPLEFKGKVFHHDGKFNLKTFWSPSVTPNVVSYEIFAYDKLLATISSNEQLVFKHQLHPQHPFGHDWFDAYKKHLDKKYKIRSVNAGNKRSLFTSLDAQEGN